MRWGQYRKLLGAKGIPQEAQRWYVTHVERFLGAVQPNSLKGLSADEITDYLRQGSSQGKWQGWQFQQLVDALQLLLVDLAEVEAARVVDWDDWREAGTVLPADHPTIAREQAPEARLKAPKFASSAEVFPILTSLARTLRTKQYSIGTEQTYVDWCHRFLRYCKDKPVETLGPVEVDAFLTHLAVERSVVPSTQGVALNALVFFFNEVLEKPLEGLKFSRVRRRDRLPVVLTREEVERLLGCMEGTYGLIAGLLYGTGMRLLEGLRLRVGDIDFGHESIVVRNGEGDKDRVVPLPKRYLSALAEHLKEVEALHRADLAAGAGTVYLPDALARQFPNAPRAWIWQFVFQSTQLSRDPRSGQIRRHHLHESSLGRKIQQAAAKSGMNKRISSHVLRHYAESRIMPNHGMSCGGALALWCRPFGIITGSSGRRAARRPGGSVLVRHRHWRSWQALALSSACRRGGRFAWSPAIHGPATRR